MVRKSSIDAEKTGDRKLLDTINELAVLDLPEDFGKM